MTPTPESTLPAMTMAGEFLVKAGWTLGPRTLDEYELVYFPLPTNTVYAVNGETFLLNKPCFILTRPMEEHSYTFDPDIPVRHLFIHFRVNSQALPVFHPSSPFIPVQETSIVPVLLKYILQLGHSASYRWTERCSQLLSTALMELEALVQTEPDQPGGSLPPQIMKAVHYIDQNLHSEITVADIAESIGWTHEHFSRMFARHVGCPPRQFILQRRINRACTLLVQEKRTVKETAYAVGFQDEHYFSRCFVKQMGMTATAYRDRFADPRLGHLAPADEYAAPYPLNHYLVFSNSHDIK